MNQKILIFSITIFVISCKSKQEKINPTEEKITESVYATGIIKSNNQLSGGEKQRVAIARALINDPDIIMGDEPTGNLDKKNSDVVFDLFKKLAEELKQTLLIVTHDQSFADWTHRIITMEDGKIIEI